MAASATTVALIGASGVVIGAIVGALSGWASAAITSRHSRRDSRADRRRGAYSAFISAAEELTRAFLVLDTMQDRSAAPGATFRDSLAPTVASIDRAYVAVLLADSTGPARSAADQVRRQAWRILEYLRTHPPGEKGTAGKADALIDDYLTICATFTKLACQNLD
jgi:hypothetical protein